jgi:hypothetical protein
MRLLLIYAALLILVACGSESAGEAGGTETPTPGSVLGEFNMSEPSGALAPTTLKQCLQLIISALDKHTHRFDIDPPSVVPYGGNPGYRGTTYPSNVAAVSLLECLESIEE